MKVNTVLNALRGAQYRCNQNVEALVQLRGEYMHVSGSDPDLTCRSIRFAVNRGGADGKLVNIIIRSESPICGLAFDPRLLLNHPHGFLFQGIIATDDIGSFKLLGSTDMGPFEVPISTHTAIISMNPQPALLISEVSLPLADGDFARE